jgi:aryl-alcohol dehydrogenase-like predicted oxidoreductase
MQIDFTHAHLGRNGPKVFRLGFSATYRPGKAVVTRALDSGINYFFGYGIDSHLFKVLRDLPPSTREHLVISTGAYNYIWTRQDLRRTLEKRLRHLRTDYIDVFLFLGVMRPEQFPPALQEELASLRETGRVRAVGISCHDRRFVGELALKGRLDSYMLRYNAAHRGAERDIFPYLEPHQPGVISYTATRWRALLKPPKQWAGPAPTAGQCYRFVLSNPHVDVCLTAPSNVKQFDENLASLSDGPLSPEEMTFMRNAGDAVYARNRWFM